MSSIRLPFIVVFYLALSSFVFADDLGNSSSQTPIKSQLSDAEMEKRLEILRAIKNANSPSTSPSWSDKVTRKVRANITFNSDNFTGTKQTIVELSLAPDGAILSRTMTMSSGDNAWDQAVLKAIDATQSLPKDDSNQLPTLNPELRFKPREDKKPIPTDVGKLTVIYQPNADSYYPSFSKRSGEQGTVIVRLIIDQDGLVEDALLLRSSGYPRLDRAATEIGKRYKFKPFLVDGKPSIISTSFSIKFSLKDDEIPSEAPIPPSVKFADLKIIEDGQKSDYFLVEQLKNTSNPFIQVLIEINEAGSVVKASAIKVSDPIVKDKAETIARHYRFKPYFIGSKASPVLSVLKIDLQSSKKIESPKSTSSINMSNSAIATPPKESKATDSKQNQSSPTSRLMTLKEMLDKGLITEKDYNSKKQEILRDM